MLLFSVKLRLLPSSGYKEIAVAGWRTHMRYMLLPGIALGFIEMGLIIRMTRSAVLEIRQRADDRVAAAAAGPLRIQDAEVLRKPFDACLGGAAVTETIFNIPGIGKLTLNAVMRRDYEVVQAVVLVVSLLNVVCTLILDLFFAMIDPRIRLQ